MSLEHSLNLRVAVPSDLDALEQLENRVFDGDRLSRRSLAAYIRNPRVAMIVAEKLVAERGGHFAGYALVAFRKKSTIARLYSIAVAPEFYAQGIGKKLLLACEKEAIRRGCTKLQLEVRADNRAAINLYRKLHYHHFDDYEEFYEDGMDAMRFERLLEAKPS